MKTLREASHSQPITNDLSRREDMFRLELKCNDQPSE